ncbi:MAG: hypothetical protein IKL28_00155 [Lachnospiraceae bacterium]|nr:hypothetical protein [Lachnospiraceae bacterium]
MKGKKIALVFAILLFLILSGTGITTYATEAKEEETKLVLMGETYRSVQIVAGGTVHVSQRIKVKEGIYENPVFTIAAEDDSHISFKNVKVKNTDPRIGDDEWVVLSEYDGDSVTLQYDICADDFATIKKTQYYISCGVPGWEYDEETEMATEVVEDLGKLRLEVSVISEKIPPQMSIISGAEHNAQAGKTVQIKFTVENQGELKAMDTYVEADYSAFDRILIPRYTPLKQKIGNLAFGKSSDVTLSYKVAEDAESQTIKLPISITYKLEDGTECSSVAYMYLYVIGKPVPTATPTPTPTATPTPTPTPEPKTTLLLLNTVKQSPAEPKAGENIKVSFYLENAGTTNVQNIKVSATGLSATGFEPLNSEPYKFIDAIKSGEKKKVELSFKVGEEIAEGLNTLNIQYSYDVKSEYGTVTETENVVLYILDVKNPEEEEFVVSRPKLMVSNFYTDVTEVTAGNNFNFTFDIMNTNESIAAKNIKVTVTGAANAFSVTAGGNSFFVNEIRAQQKEPITINLKASAAATTGAYPIQIKMEYEYEGMVVTSSYSGEIVEEEILLQVKENLRPSVENVYVGSWETPMVNQPTVMNFEFYNMGKSPLNNTYVTIEGDFMLSNGSNSYYIGNIAPGMPEYIEFDVVPLIEGTAVGKMVIHMEDSNGDEVTMEKEFTAYVMGEMMWEDPGYMDPGYMDPGYMDPSVQVDGNVAEKPIVSLWVFLGIQAAILILVIPITRAVCLALYRRKIKQEDGI